MSLLPEQRRVDQILQFTTLVEEVGGGFPLSRELSTAIRIAKTSLLLSPSDSTFSMCEWQEHLGVRERRGKNRAQLCLSV